MQINKFFTFVLSPQFTFKTLLISVLFFALFSTTVYSQEKVYLHLDKHTYVSGDDIWFKVYLVDGLTHRFEALSNMVHVYLMGSKNEVIDKRIIKIVSGGGAGAFKLPRNLLTGDYTIRAYTNYQRNFKSDHFFVKKLHISSLEAAVNFGSHKKSARGKKIANSFVSQISNSKPDVQFFPEGGSLVNALFTRVGFKAVDTLGIGISVSGRIVDESGALITAFKTSKFGMGLFSFTPMYGKHYKAIVTYNEDSYTYPLPEIKKHGISMQVSEFKDHYRISLQRASANRKNKLTLRVHQRDRVLSNTVLEGNKTLLVAKVLKTGMETGIVKFRVQDKLGIPLSERIAFVALSDSEPKIQITPSQDTYQKRGYVELGISIKDIEQQPLLANMSVSVTDASVVEKDPLGRDIKSYLLLSSEIKGYIENSGYYFNPANADRKEQLDLLMMTQGWRHFKWKRVPPEQLSELEYSVETGVRFKGHITRLYNQSKLEQADVSLMLKNKKDVKLYEVTTDSLGNFVFGDFDLKDSISVLIQARNYKTKAGSTKKDRTRAKKNYTVVLDTIDIPEIESPLPIIARERPTIPQDSILVEAINVKKEYNYLERAKAIKLVDSVYDFEGEYEVLGEVLIEQERIDKEKEERYENAVGKIYITEPSDRVDFEDREVILSGNIMEQLSMMANVVNHGDYVTFPREGNTKGAAATLVLDGMIVDYETITSVPDLDVSFIDILKGANTTIYGIHGFHGVIAVYTKRGSYRGGKLERKGVINFVYPGYYKAKAFYQPIYKVQKPEHIKPDYRATLYWAPTLNINKQGRALISFYTADIATTYRIHIEGITYNGVPFTKEGFIEVED